MSTLARWGESSKTPSVQAPEKLQASNFRTHVDRFGSWNLELLWSLEVGRLELYAGDTMPRSIESRRFPCNSVSVLKQVFVNAGRIEAPSARERRNFFNIRRGDFGFLERLIR